LVNVIVEEHFSHDGTDLGSGWYQFENRWWMYTGEAGFFGKVEWDTNVVPSGSMKITSPASTWHKTEMSMRFLPLPARKLVGVQFSFILPSQAAKVGSCDFFLKYFDGTYDNGAQIELLNSDDDYNFLIRYLTGGAGAGLFIHEFTEIYITNAAAIGIAVILVGWRE